MFCVAATTLVPGSTAAAFSVVLSVAVSTLPLGTLVIFPTVVRLRLRCPTPPAVPHPGRPRRAVGLPSTDLRPGGARPVGVGLSRDAGGLLGIKYDFTGTWGASRLTFEAFTVGTLPAIVVSCALGYWWAQRHDDVGAGFTADLQWGCGPPSRMGRDRLTVMPGIVIRLPRAPFGVSVSCVVRGPAATRYWAALFRRGPFSARLWVLVAGAVVDATQSRICVTSGHCSRCRVWAVRMIDCAPMGVIGPVGGGVDGRGASMGERAWGLLCYCPRIRPLPLGQCRGP